MKAKTKRQKSMPLEPGVVLELRKDTREGPLRTRSLRSIAYVSKRSKAETADALSGEGSYSSYPSEGVISRERYPSFYLNGIPFSQAVREATGTRTAPPPTPHKDLDPVPNGAVVIEVEPNGAVEVLEGSHRVNARSVQPGYTAPVPVNEKKPRLRGKSQYHSKAEIEAVYMEHATRTDLRHTDIEALHDLGAGAVNKIIWGKGQFSYGLPILPPRPPYFKRKAAPDSIETFVRTYGTPEHIAGFDAWLAKQTGPLPYGWLSMVIAPSLAEMPEETMDRVVPIDPVDEEKYLEQHPEVAELVAHLEEEPVADEPLRSPRTGGEAPPVSSHQPDPERPAEATTEAPVTTEEARAEAIDSTDADGWDKDVDPEDRTQGTPTDFPGTQFPRTRRPSAEEERVQIMWVWDYMTAAWVREHELAYNLVVNAPRVMHDSRTPPDFPPMQPGVTPSPHGDVTIRAGVRGEQSVATGLQDATALIRQMLEAVGPEALGWTKVDREVLHALIAEYDQAYQAMAQANRTLGAYLRIILGGYNDGE
jgi:hypothetical protein